MRAALALSALAGATAFCDSKDDCLSRVRASSSSPAGEIAAHFADLVLSAHDWENHSKLQQTTDSFWCSNNTYWQFFPAPVANMSYLQSTVSWANTGCFESMEAKVTYNGTGASIEITGKRPSGLCSDVFAVMTSYSASLIEVSALRPTASGGFRAWKPSELQDVKNAGLFFYVLPCGVTGTVESLLRTVELFDSSDATMLRTNMDFLMQRGVWPTPAVPFGKFVPLDKTKIRSGTYLAIGRMDGLDPMIMWGTGGMTGHSAIAVWEGSTLYICESTDKNPFGPVYWPPPYGVIRHEWDTWMGLAQKAEYHVAVLPFQASLAASFNETAYWAWFAGVEGARYGYPTMLGSFMDVGPQSENLPQPIISNSVSAIMNIIDGRKPVNTSSDFGVSVYTLLTVGLNQRLGLNCTHLSCILDQTVANAAKGVHPLNMIDAMAIPEDDAWRFDGNSSMVCSQLAAQGWKAGLRGALPVWNDIVGNEQSPKDNYQLNLFDGAFFTEANCPGGVITPSTGSGSFCQVMGPYEMPLNEYNTVPIYAGVDNACPSQWPSYFRCPAGQPDCC